MIITDKFVLLNFPRTGSTFLRNAIGRLYGRSRSPWGRLWGRLRSRRQAFREFELPIERTLSARRAGRRSQHGSYSQIPPEDRNRTVVSAMRHPLDLVVSQYECGFWRQNPPGDPEEVRARFPSFPDLSFGAYLDLQMQFGRRDVLQDARLEACVGPLTLHFVRFYSVDPDAALASLTNAGIDSGEFARGLPTIRFLHTEHLREELRAFLLEIGFTLKETAFLCDMPPENQAVSRRERPWTDYFSREQELEFRHRERLLFQCFPEYADG